MATEAELKAAKSAHNKRYYERKKLKLAASDNVLKGEFRTRRSGISPEVLAKARVKPDQQRRLVNPFVIPSNLHPPSATPKNDMAMDDAFSDCGQWAFQGLSQAGYYGGTPFRGFPYLAELALRPEYRKISEIISTEMTRKWIKLQSTGDEDKTEKIALLNAAFDKFNVRDVFRKAAMQDGLFGRGHIYIDLGTTADRDELQTPIGDGYNEASLSKVGKGSLKALRTVEPVWCYPQGYNSNDPLVGDWYRPQAWGVQGKEVHASRLLTLVGREVPDMLKPAYSFGGLSMSQIAEPYIENWIRTRKSVSDLLHSFTVFVLSTDMQATLQGGMGDSDLFGRADLFNLFRDNRGLMMLNKDSEEVTNVSAPLGTLDHLQAQAQEQMASIASIPLVKLLGITPSGLNASSDGEVRVFYDHVHAFQEHLFADDLDKVLGFIQLSEFGSIDPDITYSFEPLWAMDEKELADVRKIEAETGQVLIDSGVISPMEERKRVCGDPDTPYQGLDADEMPDLLEEQEEGLVLRGEAGEADLDKEPEGTAAT